MLLVGEDETQGRNVSVQACNEKAVVNFFKACNSILQVYNVKPKPMQEAVITVWPKMLGDAFQTHNLQHN